MFSRVCGRTGVRVDLPTCLFSHVTFWVRTPGRWEKHVGDKGLYLLLVLRKFSIQDIKSSSIFRSLLQDIPLLLWS